MNPTKCKLGANECLVLKGTRTLEICLKCKMVTQGTSILTGYELKVPSNYISAPQAKVIKLGGRR